MIKTELLQDGRLIRHYSDTPGMGLLQEDTGIEYSEAVDLNPTNHTYREIPMEQPEQETETERLTRENAEMRQALNTLGVQTE